MFQKKEKVVAQASAAAPFVSKGVVTKPKLPTLKVAVEEATSVAAPAPSVAESQQPKKFAYKKTVAAQQAVNAAKAAAAEKPAYDDEDEELAALVAAQEAEMEAEEDIEGKFTDIGEELTEIRDLLVAEENADPYDAPAPATYVPESRRGFADFITQTFNAYSLEAAPGAGAIPTGEKYPYQKFVREYMRQASPYRGLLVYHGLGSGKTCTAIAASEALFSTANKKIIVMTPASLKKNFLKEVTLCGFRHFQLKNYWVQIPKSDPAAELFARYVLGVGAAHYGKASAIWVPDFRKGPEESNYAELAPEQQTEIREQIMSILVWHPKTNPTGRIRFINYNGIPAATLQDMACGKERFFDDAVIIIDEVHNLVRLMQGMIDPYITNVKGLKRLIAKEEITTDRWTPTLCKKEPWVNPKKPDAPPVDKFARLYARGYLFYRLLLDAQNSKIIGLSGTPLINFPEELGILMNVLHGYIPTIYAVVDKVGDAAQKQIQTVAAENPFVDFVKVEADPAGKGTLLTITLLPQGVKKVNAEGGVARMSPDEGMPPTVREVIEVLTAAFQKAGFGFVPTSVAEPLLPPTGDDFRKHFLTGTVDLVGAAQAGRKIDLIKNDIVLLKRMTGLVSYYKGSREDLMPRVAVDEIVRVPMSLYSQRMYSEARKEEITKEKKPKDAGAEGYSGVWAEVYDVGKKKQSSNYKMASRQACNFTFPPGVVRPKAATKAELLAEATAGGKGGDDILETAPDADRAASDEPLFPELDILEKQDAAEAAQAAEDDAEADAEAEDEEAAAPVAPREIPSAVEPAGGGKEDGEEEDTAAAAAAPAASAADSGERENAEAAPAAEITEEEKRKFSLKEFMAKKAAQLKADCAVGRKKGESYPDAMKRVRKCFAGPFADKLKLGGGAAGGLDEISPKFAEMLTRIAAAKGSSLVYSQFLDMEGIGLFRLAMDANGYVPIEIISNWWDRGAAVFSKRTLESFKPGPDGTVANVPRYITFSGGEDDEIRRYALDIFNANFNDLPAGLQGPLIEAGFKNNHHGEVCRVFCITSAGAEGLSLKCVRAVHIMEPYWNDVRLKQVKGRAIRIGSHLELPEGERDVSIYTYLSCFSEEAQLAKAGDIRIDETIRNQDKIDRKDAKAMGLPIPEGAATYVMTTDERLHVIAERKKGITGALEGLMKAGAVDCELNVSENQVLCQSLKGAVGDFMYHPNLEKDIADSASKFQRVAAAEVAPAAVPAAAPPRPAGLPRGFITAKLNGTEYWMKETATGFEMFKPNDIAPDHMVATAGKAVGPAGKSIPGKPIKRTAWAKAQGITL